MSLPIRSFRAGVLAGVLGAGLVACPDARQTSEPSEPSDKAEQGSADADEIERLEALGYIDATEERADPDRVRVVRMDRARVEDGYRLYCTKGGALAELIAVDGTPVHTWRDEQSRSWTGCMLLANGDLVVVGVDRPTAPGDEPRDEERHLRRLAWDGHEIWRRNLPAHHDVVALPDGDLLTLSFDYVEAREIHPSAPVRDDVVVRLGVDGEIRSRRSLLAAFRSDPAQMRILPVEPKRRWGREQVDLIHANTVEPVVQPALETRHPLYAAGNVVVTSRNQDVVAILAWESNRLLWAWGQDELSGPHEGRVLPNGNVLVFDNGVAHGRSRVLEVEPLGRTIVWEYQADPPEAFFTPGRGGAVRLPGGNTLITNSNAAQAFEVTPEGEVVWEFLGPHLTPDDQRRTFRRMRHYPRAMVEAILAANPR